MSESMGHRTSRQERHLEQLDRVYSEAHYGLYDLLDESLHPRSPGLLFDVAGQYLQPGAEILDVGCRDGSHLITLVMEHDARAIGIDPLDWHVRQAQQAIMEAGLRDRISVSKGVIESIEQPEDRFDFVWCRDVLALIVGLELGLSEAARVLKPEGRMLVYTNFTTELLEPKEAEMINPPLGNVPESMDEQRVEAAFARAGLVEERKDVISTEWREYEEERTQPVSQSLLRLARLRRRRNEIVEKHGQDVFDIAQASLHWLAYQMLGKLQPTLYILKRA